MGLNSHREGVRGGNEETRSKEENGGRQILDRPGVFAYLPTSLSAQTGNSLLTHINFIELHDRTRRSKNEKQESIHVSVDGLFP